MPTLISAFPLLLLSMAVLSAATQLLPAFKSGAEQRPAIIRGLFDLDKRQGFCPAPRFACGSRFCCPDTTWECCSNGSCCQPLTNCELASNGIIGCCPVGELCGGPVGDPTTSTFTVTIPTTSIRTTVNTFTTKSLTTFEISVPTISPLPTIYPTVVLSSIFNPFPTTTTPTFVFNPSTTNTKTTPTSAQPTLTPGLANNSSGATRNVGAFMAILACSFMVFTRHFVL
ncbi:hypothetical protein CVT25_005495 [Psilocybe cyanescens]|uniref:Granulins domain-containing protein n=1 Tax=Psilocybe cyanescens TaxID=93625 RepID=A0A409VZW1_PSICY|nr:hypothetical protein CVT25_005495 [Psilocybe cyanescens]